MTSQSDDSTPLHNAILDNDVEGFESLLRNPNTDINAQNQLGQTALFVSLLNKTTTSFTMRLIQAGCDVNIFDKNKTTPLHRAMLVSLNNIAHELIKRGADINAKGQLCVGGVANLILTENITPLYEAIECNNLEGVCMLLYYGVDVVCSSKLTPIKFAAYRNFKEIVKILIDYYDESYYKNETKNDCFKYILRTLHLKREGTVLFGYSIQNDNADLAKLLWDKINFESILDEQDSNFLLENYIIHSHFATSDWLKYLFFIFQVFLARQFTIRTYKRVRKFSYTGRFLEYLLNALHEKNIEPTTRLRIIDLSLSLGATILVDNLREAHKLYGFGEELEALIYGCSYTIVGIIGLSPLISNVLGLEDCSLTAGSHLFKDIFRIHHNKTTVEYVCGFFSLPSEVKQEIKSVCLRFSPDEHKRIVEKLDQLPEFPTLVELSRYQARKHIRQSTLIKYPYHFHDAIIKLNLPRPVKDLIRFKRPIY